MTYIAGVFGLLRDVTSEDARAQVDEGGALLEELGQLLHRGSARMAAANAYLYAGEMSRAEDELRASHAALTAIGEKGFLSTVSALLAAALCGQGRYEVADVYAKESERVGAADDLTTQAGWRSARSQILAAQGEAEAAITLGRDAEAVVAETDMLSDQASAAMALGAAHATLGQREEARSTLERAAEMLDRKGIVPGVAYVRRLIAEL